MHKCVSSNLSDDNSYKKSYLKVISVSKDEADMTSKMSFLSFDILPMREMLLRKTTAILLSECIS